MTECDYCATTAILRLTKPDDPLGLLYGVAQVCREHVTDGVEGLTDPRWSLAHSQAPSASDS